MRWKLSDGRDWRPLVNKAFPVPPGGLVSVQAESLDYRPTSANLVAELQASLERRVKSAIDAWRPAANPRWNFEAARTFKALLPE